MKSGISCCLNMSIGPRLEFCRFQIKKEVGCEIRICIVPKINSIISLDNEENHFLFTILTSLLRPMFTYRKDTEHLYHAFVYSLVILLSGIYPFTQYFHCLLQLYVIRIYKLSTKVFISLTLHCYLSMKY